MLNLFTRKSKPTEIDKEIVQKAAYKAGLMMTDSQEFKFTARRIRTIEELRNVFKRDGDRNYTLEDIVEIVRMTDSETWQPLLVFALKREGRTFMEWMKFIIEEELLAELEKKDEQDRKVAALHAVITKSTGLRF